MQWLSDAEFAFLDILQKLHSDLMDIIMRIFTFMGDNGYIWIALCVVLLCIPKTRRVGISLAVCLITEVLITNVILKNLVARQRPCWINSYIDTVIANPHDFSFPSGHSGASFVSATVIFRHNKKYGIICYVLSAIIAFSRMYFYVHFPTDILAGLIIGIASGIIMDKLVTHFMKKYDDKHNNPDAKEQA